MKDQEGSEARSTIFDGNGDQGQPARCYIGGWKRPNTIGPCDHKAGLCRLWIFSRQEDTRSLMH